MKKKEEQISLEVELRKELGKTSIKHLRQAGFVPAVVYGQKKATQLIKIKRGVMLKFLHEHGKENVIINLKIIEDSKISKERPVLIKDIQRGPLKGDPIHIDFYEVSLTKAITVEVPLVVKGEPIGVKQEGGMLERHLWALNIECLPTQIPKEIEFDVSNLKMGDVVHIKDLAIPQGLKVLHEPDLIVFSVVMPKKEVAPVEEVTAAEPTEPEVIKEKKKLEEEVQEGKEEKGKKEERGKEEKKE